VATELSADGATRVAGTLDVKSRSRWALGLVFTVATVALLVGTWRASGSAESVQIFVDAQAAASAGRELEAALIGLEREMWRFEAQPVSESARRLGGALSASATALVEAEKRVVALARHPSATEVVEAWVNASGGPLLSRAAPLASMRAAIGRTRGALGAILDAPEDTSAADRSAAFRDAHTAVETLTADAGALSAQAAALVNKRAEAAERSINYVSRDQLVLFLLVAFLLPLGVSAGVRWITTPLVDLQRVAKQIEAGRVKQMEVSGTDEIAQVARAMRAAVRRLEQNDRRQKDKIFEMRRILRSLIQPVSDAVLVIGRGGKIDYANPAAAQLLATEVHNLETEVVDEVLFSPTFGAALESAWMGDVSDEGVDVRIETDDGRVAEVHTALRSVRDQRGEITRVVVVIRA
jgi:PAS domain S-box-containing protein